MGATVQKRRWSGLWKSFTFLSQKWNSRQGPCGSWATGRWFSRPVRSFKKESRDRWRFLTSTNIDASCIGYHARITKLLRGSRASQKREKSISPRAGTMPECNETFWQWYLRPRETDRSSKNTAHQGCAKFYCCIGWFESWNCMRALKRRGMLFFRGDLRAKIICRMYGILDRNRDRKVKVWSLFVQKNIYKILLVYEYYFKLFSKYFQSIVLQSGIFFWRNFAGQNHLSNACNIMCTEIAIRK